MVREKGKALKVLRETGTRNEDFVNFIEKEFERVTRSSETPHTFVIV